MQDHGRNWSSKFLVRAALRACAFSLPKTSTKPDWLEWLQAANRQQGSTARSAMAKQPAVGHVQPPAAPRRAHPPSSWSGLYMRHADDTPVDSNSESYCSSLLQKRIHHQQMFGPTFQQLGRIAGAWCALGIPRLAAMTCLPLVAQTGQFSLLPWSATAVPQPEAAGADGLTARQHPAGLLACQPIRSTSDLLTRLSCRQSSKTHSNSGSSSTCSRAAAGHNCIQQLNTVTDPEVAYTKSHLACGRAGRSSTLIINI